MFGSVGSLPLCTAGSERIREVVGPEDRQSAFVGFAAFRHVAGVFASRLSVPAVAWLVPRKFNLVEVAIVSLSAIGLLVINNHGNVEATVFKNSPR